MAYPRFNRSRQFKQVTRNTGNITVTTAANTWEELAAEPGGPGTGGFDLTLNEVQVGDVIEAGFTFFTGNSAGAMVFDVRTMNGATPINSLANQAAATPTAGVQSPWYAEASRLVVIGPPIFYTVSPLDLIGGAVTFRPYALGQTTTAKIIYAEATYRFQFWVRNNGPAQA